MENSSEFTNFQASYLYSSCCQPEYIRHQNGWRKNAHTFPEATQLPDDRHRSPHIHKLHFHFTSSSSSQRRRLWRFHTFSATYAVFRSVKRAPASSVHLNRGMAPCSSEKQRHPPSWKIHPERQPQLRELQFRGCGGEQQSAQTCSAGIISTRLILLKCKGAWRKWRIFQSVLHLKPVSWLFIFPAFRRCLQEPHFVSKWD